MSLPPDTEAPETDAPKKVPGWRQPWDRWRILMFAGSIVLLGLAIARVGGPERIPGWLTTAVYLFGYGLLGYGFFLAMRTRKEIRAKREAEEKKKKRVSLRDR